MNEMIGLLMRYHPDTIGVIVASSKDNYTLSAITIAKISDYNILLTDKHDILSDINRHIDMNRMTRSYDSEIYICTFLFFTWTIIFLIFLLFMTLLTIKLNQIKLLY